MSLQEIKAPDQVMGVGRIFSRVGANDGFSMGSLKDFSRGAKRGEI